MPRCAPLPVPFRVPLLSDPAKFISGSLLSLSAMIQLELPHLNILTKCDLVDEDELERVLQVT